MSSHASARSPRALLRSFHAAAALLLAAAPAAALVIAGAPATARQACVWSGGASAPVTRFEGQTLVVDDRLLVLGGFTAPFPSVTPRVDRYDPATNTWTRLGDMPVAFTHAPPARDGRTVWFAGGFEGNHPGQVVATVWKYDVDLDSWSNGPSLPHAVGGGALVRVERHLHYFGGVLSDRNTGSTSHWRLDLDNPTGWVARSPLPVPRNHLSAAVVGGLVYAIGGQERHDTNPVDTALVHVYDPLANSWSARSDMPFSRSHSEPGTFVDGERIVLCGGKSSSLGLPQIPDCTAYLTASDAWRTSWPLPESRLAPSAQAIRGELIATSGGGAGLAPKSQTWRRPLATPFDGGRRINAGGPSHTGAGGEPWCADHGMEGEGTYTNPAIQDIAGTDDDALYKSERYGGDPTPELLVGRFPLDPGLYRLRLHFAEIYYGAPNGPPGGVGKRVFDVRVEDRLLLEDYDVTAAVGALTADVHVFDLEVLDFALDLELVSSVDRPKINALEIERLPDGAFERYCDATVNSTGAAAAIDHLGSFSIAENELLLSAAPVPNQPGIFFYGPQATQLPFGDGFRCVGGQLGRLGVHVASGNVLSHALDVTSPPSAPLQITAGSRWYFQAWFRDPAAGASGFNLSDGLAATFTP